MANLFSFGRPFFLMVRFEDWAANAVFVVPSTSLLPAFLSLPLGIKVSLWGMHRCQVGDYVVSIFGACIRFFERLPLSSISFVSA